MSELDRIRTDIAFLRQMRQIEGGAMETNQRQTMRRAVRSLQNL